MVYTFDPLGSLVTILVTALFIYFAARFVLDRSSIVAAILSAVISTLLAGWVVALVGGGTLGIILGLLVWSLLTAVFFRTGWMKGAIIGLVAWALSLVVLFILSKF